MYPRRPFLNSLIILLSAAMASPAWAQQGVPPPSSSPSAKSYGAGTAIGISVGAAAALGIGLYMIRHRRANRAQSATLVGCTQIDNGVMLVEDDTTKVKYTLFALREDVKPGERVVLTGKKSQDASGKNLFHVRKLVKDDGPCSSQTASTGFAM